MLARWHDSMRTALERHGGTVEKFVGDAVMAVFGLPVAHEDDALRARCGSACRSRSAQSEELGRDYGVESPSTPATWSPGGETLVTGDVVNVAARLEQARRPARSSSATRRSPLGEAALVSPSPDLALKGKAQPVSAWRSSSVLPDVPAFTRPIATPFVGRERSSPLSGAFERAVRPACELVTVARPARDRQVAPDARSVPSVGEHASSDRPLPLLRRGHHLLAAHRDREQIAGQVRSLGSRSWQRGRERRLVAASGGRGRL